MRSTFHATAVAVGCLLAAATAPAAGTAQVSFVQSDKFSDAGDARRDIEGNLRVLARHVEALATRYLSDGQKLTVEVLDVDLAGEVLPSHRWHQDVRVLKGGADWPRIKLRYTLEAAGQAPRSGEQIIADMAYLQHIGGGYVGDEPLRHEKRMLNEWFVAQFAGATAR